MSGRVWVALIATVAISGAIAYLIAPASNAGFAEGAGALAFVTLVAVAIERMLEMWWGIVGGRLGGWWRPTPLRPIHYRSGWRHGPRSSPPCY